MKIVLSDYKTGKLLLECYYPPNFGTNLDIEEREYEIESNYTLYIKEKWFFGIHISFSKIRSLKPEQFILENSSTHIVFLFCLEGVIKCKDNSNKEVISLIKNQQFINPKGFDKLIASFIDNTEYLYLQLTKDHYRNLTGDEFNNDISIYDSVQIEPEVKLILNSLINQKNHERIRRISLEAKIYELLAFFINKASNISTSSLKKHDLDKILYAKKIVEENIQSPNSLIELSRKAGINDYKLKIGFKEVTGYTVFGYLCKIRMEKAYYLLSNEKKTVNEVAFLVGYKNAQHFTVAFKKKYNILPGSLNKDKFLHANV